MATIRTRSTRYRPRSTSTTVNVTVPRPRSSSGRSRSTTTRTRTLREVYTPTTPAPAGAALLVGGAALAAGALYLFWPRAASAALPPVPGPGQPGGPPLPGPVPATPGFTPTPMNPAYPQDPRGPAGFAGAGTYRITAPSGLNVRPQSNTSQPTITTLPVGTTVEVISGLANGWVQISTPTPGYLCMSCADAPGGPWLVRQS